MKSLSSEMALQGGINTDLLRYTHSHSAVVPLLVLIVSSPLLSPDFGGFLGFHSIRNGLL